MVVFFIASYLPNVCWICFDFLTENIQFEKKKPLYRAFNENLKNIGIPSCHKKRIQMGRCDYNVLCIICILYSFFPMGSHDIWWVLFYLRLVTFFSLSASWLVSLSTSPPSSEAPWPAVSSLSPLLMSCNTMYILTCLSIREIRHMLDYCKRICKLSE